VLGRLNALPHRLGIYDFKEGFMATTEAGMPAEEEHEYPPGYHDEI
jgi:hypothetical protein